MAREREGYDIEGTFFLRVKLFQGFPQFYPSLVCYRQLAEIQLYGLAIMGV